MPSIKQHTAVLVGQNFHPGAKELLAETPIGTPVQLVHEADNQYDANAVAVMIGKQHCGHVVRGQAAYLAPDLDAGKVHGATLAGPKAITYDVEVDDETEEGAAP